MSRFGERLRLARSQRGITQEQLAEMADISRAMIGRYETTNQLPALDTLVRVADALGTSTDFLLGRTASIDKPFQGEYMPPKPSRPSSKLPKNTTELEALIREIVNETLQGEMQSDK
ncbi:MAG: helix-turn-helix transcriptional regulator [Clostridia bacterium]|nr:helix-turn-helix transcriptional regulator [Clostridia bacterium]